VRKLYFWPEDDPRHWTLRGVARETRQWLGQLRPFIFGGILLSIWPAADPALIDPPGFLQTEPEMVDEPFSRCGPGRSHACVIDGDTFKIGQRKIRIIGIDAPEIRGQCRRELELAVASTARLQALLNQGPFEMVGRVDDRQDRYGRDLRSVRRQLPDGSYQSIAAEMRASGLARRYHGFKSSWC
jgi:endonuclease YncB( thermonuclease family)